MLTLICGGHPFLLLYIALFDEKNDYKKLTAVALIAGFAFVWMLFKL